MGLTSNSRNPRSIGAAFSRESHGNRFLYTFLSLISWNLVQWRIRWALVSFWRHTQQSGDTGWSNLAITWFVWRLHGSKVGPKEHLALIVKFHHLLLHGLLVHGCEVKIFRALTNLSNKNAQKRRIAFLKKSVYLLLQNPINRLIYGQRWEMSSLPPCMLRMALRLPTGPVGLCDAWPNMLERTAIVPGNF